jgi:hypothetical protein
MFKFLRKYNKYILAVGGTLLLITFLIPYAFTQLLQGTGGPRGTWATVGHEKQRKVTYDDLAVLQREMRLIDSAGSLLQMPIAIDRADYWYLLTLEAQNAGVVPAPGSVMATEQGQQQLALLAAISGESIGFVQQTRAKVLGVQQLLRLYIDGDKYSDRRLKQLARRLYHRVTIRPVVIEATADGGRSYTEQELADQLEEYADVAPGEGDMGFGYRLPDRAGIEWLAIPTDTVREMISNSDQLNRVALRKHWTLESRKGRFDPPDAGAPIPDAVREDLLERLTQKALDRIERSANDQLRFTRRGLGKRNGYEDLPDGWTGLSYQQLALDLQAEYGIALPHYQATGSRLRTADELRELDGIGTASTDKFGPTPVSLTTLVQGARAFGGSTMIPIQQGVTGPPLRDADRSVYLFRITATDTSRPPNSVEEVRDQLIADLNRVEDYERLTGNAQGIRQVAVADGLLALAMQYDTPVKAPTNLTLGFSASLPGIGVNEELVEAIVDHAMALPRDIAVADLPEQERVLVLPVQDNLSLLVARLMDQTPLTQEIYKTYMQYGLVQSKLLAEEVATDDPKKEFGFEALAERHAFQLTRPDDAPTTQPDESTVEAGM